MKTSDKIDNLVATIMQAIADADRGMHLPQAPHNTLMLTKALQALFPEVEVKEAYSPENPPTPPYEVEYENRTPQHHFDDLNKVSEVLAEIGTMLEQPFMSLDSARVAARKARELGAKVHEEIEKSITNKQDGIRPEVPEGFVRCDIPVGSQIICPPNTDVSSAGKTEALIDKLKPITLQFNKTMDEVKNMDHPNPVTIITQEELNQFKAVEKEKTETLEKHLFGGKENSQQDKPKFPPVMYSPDGVKVNRASDHGMYANFMGDKKDIPCLTHYSKLIREGFTEHPPMRSREEIKKEIERLELLMLEHQAGRFTYEQVFRKLKWVLNEE